MNYDSLPPDLGHEDLDDEEDIDPFHDGHSNASIYRRGSYSTSILSRRVIDWINAVERIFNFNDMSGSQKVKLVAIKLKKHASIWRDNLKKQREQEGKRRIITWEKMKELKRKFLSETCTMDAFHKFHNFRQEGLTVEEYTTEFKHLML